MCVFFIFGIFICVKRTRVFENVKELASKHLKDKIFFYYYLFLSICIKSEKRVFAVRHATFVPYIPRSENNWKQVKHR